MPELPEVQYFTNFFNQHALHQQIQQVLVKDPIVLKDITPEKFQKILHKTAFKPAYRCGKFMIVPLMHNQHYLVMHYGMTGNLQFKKWSSLQPADTQYAQAIFIFQNGNALLWISKRKFGKIFLVKNIDEIKTVKTMGPDPLTLTDQQFMTLYHQHAHKNIKGFLMDQAIIAGIGNEYSNEILFQAHIDPHVKVNQLTQQQKKQIITATRSILKKAITIDTIGQQYPPNWLLAHKRDLQCPRHPQHKLIKETIAGRTAVYCPKQLITHNQ